MARRDRCSVDKALLPSHQRNEDKALSLSARSPQQIEPSSIACLPDQAFLAAIFPAHPHSYLTPGCRANTNIRLPLPLLFHRAPAGDLMESSIRVEKARIIRSYQPDEARQMKALRALMKACPAPIADAQNADAREDAGDAARLPCGPDTTEGQGQPIPSPRRTMR
jgi:hypothetical protein